VGRKDFKQKDNFLHQHTKELHSHNKEGSAKAKKTPILDIKGLGKA
jgi:hypothetical protein